MILLQYMQTFFILSIVTWLYPSELTKIDIIILQDPEWILLFKMAMTSRDSRGSCFNVIY